MQIKAESLAYWYFRLNGFLTIRDFLVHPDTRRDRGTDVDILGVRFPYRAELFNKPMIDDPILTFTTDRPFIVIAEVKKGLCSLNGPWTRPEDRNMQRVIRAIGAFKQDQVERIANDLYNNGFANSSDYYLSLFCIGERVNEELSTKYTKVPQVTWEHIVEFIYERLHAYAYEKSWHDPWDEDAKNLWETMIESSDKNQFANKVNVIS